MSENEVQPQAAAVSQDGTMTPDLGRELGELLKRHGVVGGVFSLVSQTVAGTTATMHGFGDAGVAPAAMLQIAAPLPAQARYELALALAKSLDNKGRSILLRGLSHMTGPVIVHGER